MFGSAPYFCQFKSNRVIGTDCENESDYGVYSHPDDMVFSRGRHLSTAIEELKRRTNNGDETTLHMWVAPS
jgi:hypothetical protein